MPSITLVVVLSALVPGGATWWRSGSRRRCSDGSSDVDHEARRLDDECPRTRGCNAPQPYSTMSLDESSPTYFSSAGFPADLEAAVARGVDLAAAFLGRVGPVPVVMMELEKDASAYSSMTAAVKAWKGFGFDIQEEVDDAMDRTCDGRDEDHCQDQCSWDDDDEICRKNEAYYASSRSSCMCGGYAIEYVPLFFAIHGDKETPKNIQQRAIHEYAHAFQFSRGGVWANFLVEGGAVLLECVVGEYYDDWGGDLEPWAYCLREVARNALEVYAYGNWTRAVPSKAALTVDWECPGDDPWPAADPANMQRKVFYDLAAVVVLFAVERGGGDYAEFFAGPTGPYLARAPYADIDHVDDWPSAVPEGAGWRKAVTDWTGDEKVDDIFAAADAWLATATIDDVLARFAAPPAAPAPPGWADAADARSCAASPTSTTTRPPTTSTPTRPPTASTTTQGSPTTTTATPTCASGSAVIDWREGMGPSEQALTVCGDESITFQWGGNHNVRVVLTKDEFDRCLADDALMPGAKDESPYTITQASSLAEIDWSPGYGSPIYFICSISDHCLNGQKIAITVTRPTTTTTTQGATSPTTTTTTEGATPASESEPEPSDTARVPVAAPAALLAAIVVAFF